MQKCKECGLIHPPAVNGQCPVAKANKLVTTDKGKIIVKFVSKLTDYLDKAKDWQTIISRINNLLGI